VNGELLVVESVPVAFSEMVRSRCSQRDRPTVMALSGGSTARRCYEQLSVDTDMQFWAQIDLIWGDERCVPLNDRESNYFLAEQALGGHLDAARSVNPMRCDDGAAEYGALISSLGGPDLVHLGLGPDGHTASLFPGSRGLDATGDVTLNEDSLGNNAYRRMTLTFPLIARSGTVIVTVEGEAKNDALRRVLADDPSTPASRLHAAELVWLVDAAALGSLKPR